MNREQKIAGKHDKRVEYEDFIWGRILLWLGCILAGEILLLALGRFYVPQSTAMWEIQVAMFLRNVMNYGRWVTLALVTVSAICFTLSVIKGKKCGPAAIAVAVSSAMCLVTFLAHNFQKTGLDMAFRMGLVLAVLVMVFYLYQREFFVSALLSAGAALGLWLFRELNGRLDAILYVVFALLLVGVLAALVLTRKCQKGEGQMKLAGRMMKLFPEADSFSWVYGTCAIVAVALVAALLVGTSMAYYLLCALIGWIFIMAVNFTVKAM